MIDLDALDDILDAGWNRVSGVRSASARRWHDGMFIVWSVILNDDTGWFASRMIYSDDPTSDNELEYDLLHSCSVGKDDGYPSAPEALRALIDEIDDVETLDLIDDSQPALL